MCLLDQLSSVFSNLIVITAEMMAKIANDIHAGAGASQALIVCVRINGEPPPADITHYINTKAFSRLPVLLGKPLKAIATRTICERAIGHRPIYSGSVKNLHASGISVSEFDSRPLIAAFHANDYVFSQKMRVHAFSNQVSAFTLECEMFC